MRCFVFLITKRQVSTHTHTHPPPLSQPSQPHRVVVEVKSFPECLGGRAGYTSDIGQLRMKICFQDDGSFLRCDFCSCCPHSALSAGLPAVSLFQLGTRESHLWLALMPTRSCLAQGRVTHGGRGWDPPLGSPSSSSPPAGKPRLALLFTPLPAFLSRCPS